jgi:hypothetical protein
MSAFKVKNKLMIIRAATNKNNSIIQMINKILPKQWAYKIIMK